MTLWLGDLPVRVVAEELAGIPSREVSIREADRAIGPAFHETWQSKPQAERAPRTLLAYMG